MKQLLFLCPLFYTPAGCGCTKVPISNNKNISHLQKVNPTSALLWRTALLLLVVLMFSNALYAQQEPLPSSDRCTSKDLELVRARLLVDACQKCDPGELITAPLELTIFNKTSSLRRAFSVWGNIVITDASGQVTYEAYIKGCEGPIAKNGNTSIPFDVVLVNEITNLTTSGSGLTGTEITYECGSTITLTKLFLAWTDASPNSTCATVQSNLIAPKCGTLDAIAVSTGLSASAVPTNVTCSGAANGSINATVSGGTPFSSGTPYRYSWVATNGGVIPTGQADDQDLTGLVPGTYTLTVTDAAGCEVTLAPITITQPDALARPVVAITEATLCGTVTKPYITVLCPIAGATYTLTQGGVSRPVTVTGSTVQFLNLEAGQGFSIIVTKDGCTSAATTCSNATNTCPAATTATVAPTSAKAPSSAEMSVKADSDMKVYPIPFSDKTTLEFKSIKDEDYVINLYDLKGTLIKQLKSGKAKAGEIIQVEVDGRGMAESMYLARKVSKTGVSTVKLLKKL
jgi:hypothetical protein